MLWLMLIVYLIAVFALLYFWRQPAPESRVIHIIRGRDGALMATSRGVTPERAEQWKRDGFEVFEVTVMLPRKQSVGVRIVGVL